MKTYRCVVTIVWDGNEEDAKDQQDYIRMVKRSFYESYEIDLQDSEISNIEEVA